MNKAERERVHESIKNILVAKEIIQKEIQKIYETRNRIYSDEMEDLVKTYGLSGSLAGSIFFPDYSCK